MSHRIGRSYRTILFGVVLVGIVLALTHAIQVLLVLFGGLLFALALRAVTSAISRGLHLPYAICLAAVVLCLLAAMVSLAAIAGPKLAAELSELFERLPRALQEVVARIPIPRADQASPRNNAGNIGSVASGAFAAVGTSVEVLGAAVIVFFVGVYGAANPAAYKRSLLAVMPSWARRDALRAVHAATHNLTRWLLGRLAAMTFVGVSCAILFAILKIPLGMSLAVLAGTLTFVEYVGAITSAIPAVLLAYTRSPTSALIVLIAFTVLHVIEGYVLTPLLARASVRFPPALTLAGQATLGVLCGPLGLTFSTPLWIVVVSVTTTLRSSRRYRSLSDRRVRNSARVASLQRATNDSHEA